MDNLVEPDATPLPSGFKRPHDDACEFTRPPKRLQPPSPGIQAKDEEREINQEKPTENDDEDEDDTHDELDDEGADDDSWMDEEYQNYLKFCEEGSDTEDEGASSDDDGDDDGEEEPSSPGVTSNQPVTMIPPILQNLLAARVSITRTFKSWVLRS